MFPRARALSAVGGVLLGLSALAAGCSEPEPAPNLLLVTIDTLRADHTSLHGYARDTTPELARLAEGGTVFERALSPSSWTLPAMSMLLTGEVQVRNESQIFPEQTSLAEVLRDRGYRTGAVVANQLLDRKRGFHSGFDDYRVSPPEHGQRFPLWEAPEVTALAEEFLARDREPFFLLVHYFDPHDPYRPRGGASFPPFDDPARMEAFHSALPEEHRHRFDREVYRGIEEHIARYDAEVRQTDRFVGRLLARLEEQGLAERTLVVVTADHGEGLWQRAANAHEELKREAFFPWLYFEHGVQLYDEQVRVPLVLRGPGVEAGVRVERAVSLIDLAPTVLSLLGVPQPPSMAGAPFLPLGGGEEEPVYSICSRGTAVTAEGRYRLHLPRDYRLELGVEPELYDLENDPRELRPLDDPAREAELRALVEGWLATHGERELGTSRISREEQESDLGKLGYTVDEMLGEDAPEPEDGSRD